MNPEHFDPNDPLEARLQALRPTELPSALAENLAQAQPRRIHRLAFAAPLAAAAVWAIVSLVTHRGPSDRTASVPQPSDLRVYVPIEEKSTLVEVQDLGLIESIPTRPVRLMRYTWVDDTTFRGDDGRSTIRSKQPREQIIPVVLQAF
ncbi:MAG TPA: hypothetical protein VFG14_04125 [Chthoniobacteraceae bacterium]|nr:hypothetical protein [Chthoniobacteraceae bacterium]